MRDYLAFMRQYYPDGDAADFYNIAGYNYAMLMVYVLRACGDELSRENVMRQATSLHDLKLPMYLPGITLNTSPTDYSPIKKLHLVRFDGKFWVRVNP